MAQTQRPGPGPLRKTTWQLLFTTKDLLKDYEELKFEDFELKDRQLRRIGAQLTQDRQRFIDKARVAENKEKGDAGSGQEEIDKYARKLKSRAQKKVIGDERK